MRLLKSEDQKTCNGKYLVEFDPDMTC